VQFYPAVECHTREGFGFSCEAYPFVVFFIDNADILVEVEESIARNGKANNFVSSWVSPKCLDENPELVLEQGKRNQLI
jgi:hypothetical protein